MVGDLRYMPHSPQSEAGNERDGRSRSRHKFKKRPNQNKRFASSEKSDQSLQSLSFSNEWKFKTSCELDSMLSSEESKKREGVHKEIDLSNYLETLVKKLSMIRSGSFNFSKEVTYAELMRLVKNCEKLTLDFDLLIGSKLGKYIQLAYVILLKINDIESLGYQRLLPRISKIRKICRDRILSFFSSDRSKLQKADYQDIESGKSLKFPTTQEKINFLMLNYEKETKGKASKKQAPEVVSLLDDEEVHTRKKIFSIPKRQKKKYSKDEHALKRAWKSKTSSSCHSFNSSARLSNSSINISHQMKRPPLFGKFGGQPLFKSPVARPQFQQPLLLTREHSGISSIKSEVSNSNSMDSFLNMPRKLIREMNTNQIIQIKREGHLNHGEMPTLRKKVCRKVYSILHKEFKKPKQLSKKLTLALEYRINVLHPSEKISYMKTVKSMFKKLRRHDISVEELVQIAKKPLGSFKLFLQEKAISRN